MLWRVDACPLQGDVKIAVSMAPQTADRIKSLMRDKGLSVSSEQIAAADADNDGDLNIYEQKLLTDADTDQNGRLSQAEDLELFDRARSGLGKSFRNSLFAIAAQFLSVNRRD